MPPRHPRHTCCVSLTPSSVAVSVPSIDRVSACDTESVSVPVQGVVGTGVGLRVAVGCAAAVALRVGTRLWVSVMAGLRVAVTRAEGVRVEVSEAVGATEGVLRGDGEGVALSVDAPSALGLSVRVAAARNESVRDMWSVAVGEGGAMGDKDGVRVKVRVPPSCVSVAVMLLDRLWDDPAVAVSAETRCKRSEGAPECVPHDCDGTPPSPRPQFQHRDMGTVAS